MFYHYLVIHSQMQQHKKVWKCAGCPMQSPSSIFSQVKQRCQNRPLFGCAPNSTKTHTYTKLEKPKSTSTERLTWLLKRLLQTLTVCCCRTAENPENVPLSELSLCRSPTVHYAKNGYLRYPCVDATETKVRFSQAHCSHELSSLAFFLDPLK